VEDDMKEKEIDAAIARYRDELAGEAALADRDLAEIEDHMRELIGELRDTMPLADAIIEARRRFGDPRAVAREHAQVRTPFGARLSGVRVWSAVALLVPIRVITFLAMMQNWDIVGDWLGYGILIEAVLNAGMFAALACRLTWARAMFLGGLPLMIVWNIANAVMWPPIAHMAAADAVACAGALVLLMPWRRGEMTPAGWGLALVTPGYSGAVWMLTNYTEYIPGIAPRLGPLAAALVILGGAGAVMRARWAAPVTLLAAVCLAFGTSWAWQFHMAPNDTYVALLVVCMALGVATTALAAALQWRHATTALGTLRSLR
jgi:hypothetical protein